jgi:hypothetical protein
MPVVHIKSKLSQWVSQMDTTKQSLRNTHPHASQSRFLKKSQITNNFITGYELSDNFESILADPKHVQHDLAKEKKEIEDVLKVNLVGGSENEFLKNLKIDLCFKARADNMDNEVKLELNNPTDRVKYRAAIANGLVAPTKDDIISNPSFFNCAYYFSDIKGDESARKKSGKIRNVIASKLVYFEDNKLWLLAVNKVLGLPTNRELSIEVLYNQIDEHKTKLTKLVELERIEEIVNKPPQDLLLDFTIKAAKDFMFIVQKDKGYYFRDLRICESIEDVHTKLQSEKNEPILASIKKLVLETYKIM